MPKKVIVALSGGVDSSSVVLMLLEKGYTVEGVTLGLGISDENAFRGAREFCESLRIPYHFFDLSQEFDQIIKEYFKKEYLAGRTPNPCVLCNRVFKFGRLWEIKEQLGGDYLATGHYVKCKPYKDGNYYFFKGEDPGKEQTYFLWKVREEILPYLLFPLGDWRKEDVRQYMSKKNITISRKKSSRDICFIKSDYREWLKENLPEGFVPGRIVDTSGRVLGNHQGIINYTIGQRKGLGIAYKYPLYVLKIDVKNNEIVVGSEEEAYSDTARLSEVKMFDKSLEKKGEFHALVKVRYRHREAEATVRLEYESRALVKFSKPQWAITPGQSAVFYDQEGRVLGGGIIE